MRELLLAYAKIRRIENWELRIENFLVVMLTPQCHSERSQKLQSNFGEVKNPVNCGGIYKNVILSEAKNLTFSLILKV